jgi:GntR family transcriptional regulator
MVFLIMARRCVMIQIDNSSSKALYEQVYEEIQRLILSRALKPDEKLPSVRELAAMVKINPNTIQKAYKSLEEDNYIYTVKGKGNFVNNTVELRNVYRRNTEEKLNEAVCSLKNLGLKDDYIVELVEEVLNPSKG